MKGLRRFLLFLLLLSVPLGMDTFAEEQAPSPSAEVPETEAKSFLLKGLATDYVFRIELLPRYRSRGDPLPTFSTQKLETAFGDVRIPLSQVPIAVGEGKNPYPMPKDTMLAAGPFGLADFFPPEASLPGAERAREALENLISSRAPLARKSGFFITHIHPRQLGGFAWEDVDVRGWGEDFAFREQDRAIASAQMRELNVLPIISPWKYPRKVSNYVPEALEAYQRFVSATVRRYDGDRSQDYEILRYPVLYYQLEENLAATHLLRYREGFMSPEQYARVLRATYEALKRANRSACLILGAIDLNPDFTLDERAENYFRTLGEEDASRYFDLFALNLTVRQFDPARMERALNEIRSLLKTDKPFVVSKLVIESPPPGGRSDWQRAEDEARQAALLLDTYLWLLTHGCRKIFWANLQDRGPSIKTPYAGVITRDGDLKLAYYTHRRLAELLGGSDLANTKGISDGEEGLYVFRLRRLDLNRPIFLIWQARPSRRNSSSGE